MGRRKSMLDEVAPNVAEPVGAFVEEFVVKPLFDDDGVQVSSGIGKDGREYPDPVPMSVPVYGELPVSLIEMMRAMIRREVEPDNEFEIDESEEEANDFEVSDDEVEVVTDYEKVFMPKPEVAEVLLKSEVPVVVSSEKAPVAPVAVEEKTKLT